MVQPSAPRKWQGLPGNISCPRTLPAAHPSQHARQVPHWRCDGRVEAMGMVRCGFMCWRQKAKVECALRPAGSLTFWNSKSKCRTHDCPSVAHALAPIFAPYTIPTAFSTVSYTGIGLKLIAAASWSEDSNPHSRHDVCRPLRRALPTPAACLLTKHMRPPWGVFLNE